MFEIPGRRDSKAHAHRNELKLYVKKQGVLRPTKSTAFVWCVEKALDRNEA
jgi:hypothetical protein